MYTGRSRYKCPIDNQAGLVITDEAGMSLYRKVEATVLKRFEGQRLSSQDLEVELVLEWARVLTAKRKAGEETFGRYYVQG